MLKSSKLELVIVNDVAESVGSQQCQCGDGLGRTRLGECQRTLFANVAAYAAL